MIFNKTKNTIRSSVWGFFNRVITLICPFITRTCIIYVMGTEYVGLNSLFTSIISILSLAELGFGSAIVYSMYEPIANGDDKKICALMSLYRKVYRYIGIIVLIVGIMLIPFIPCFIKNDIPQGINIYFLYGLYLLNSVVSYWLFAYKNCLLAAHQRNDVSFNISTCTSLLMYILQIIAVCSFQNYYYFVICIPIFSILNNIITAVFVDRMYPQYYSKGTVDKLEVDAIKKQVIGLLSQRLAFSSRNAFDSIIISSFLGLTIVGMYNNYFYILNAVTAILSLIFTSMQGGIGNSIVKETVEKNYSNFRMINFMYMWIAGWCTICLLVLMQDFVELWVGAEFMFRPYITFLFVFYFWSMKMTDTVGAYIAGTGIWWKCRYTYLLESAVNLILNICLGYLWGVLGVIIATIVSVIFVNFIASAYILFKFYFQNGKIKTFFADNIKYTIVVGLAGAITYLFAEHIRIGSNKLNMFLMMFLKMLLCCFIPNIILYFMYQNNEQFYITKKWITNKVQNKIYKK